MSYYYDRLQTVGDDVTDGSGDPGALDYSSDPAAYDPGADYTPTDSSGDPVDLFSSDPALSDAGGGASDGPYDASGNPDSQGWFNADGSMYYANTGVDKDGNVVDDQGNILQAGAVPPPGDNPTTSPVSTARGGGTSTGGSGFSFGKSNPSKPASAPAATGPASPAGRIAAALAPSPLHAATARTTSVPSPLADASPLLVIGGVLAAVVLLSSRK